VVSTIDYSRPHSIQVPDSDIGYHFGSLLDNQEGVDVIVNVGGERFHAHKLVLAARSSVFRSQLFNDESDEEKSEVDESDELKEFAIDDMEPKVFKVCFCSYIDFVLPEQQQFVTIYSESIFSAGDASFHL
jgi:speckle-type POZ protein